MDNWVGKVYLIPRTEITRSKDRPELAQTGIYLLFGTDTETGEELLYVGQARERKNGNGVLARVAEHLGEEKLDYFTHAILIIDSDNSFGPTEISYLENAFYQQALIADRVRAVNGNDSSPGNVTEEKKAALDEFISMAK
ncbi:GIY-YIG nuclease family protein, partial [Corynebacterium vitaeruminis]|uniref:GIY-YIG nuclease family protein n=1 Tax=Corynebacterium vitaeruminis TaxID=38305 RepID=UPI001E4AF3CD